MIPDASTVPNAAQLAALLVALVAVTKPLITRQATTADVIRAVCAFAGAALVPLYTIGNPGFTASIPQIRELVTQGFFLGAGTTFGYAGAQAAVAKVSVVRSALSRSESAPATSSAPASAPAPQPAAPTPVPAAAVAPADPAL